VLTPTISHTTYDYNRHAWLCGVDVRSHRWRCPPGTLLPFSLFESSGIIVIHMCSTILWTASWLILQPLLTTKMCGLWRQSSDLNEPMTCRGEWGMGYPADARLHIEICRSFSYDPYRTYSRYTTATPFVPTRKQTDATAARLQSWLQIFYQMTYTSIPCPTFQTNLDVRYIENRHREYRRLQ
jgi:hypothetical protein